MKRSFLKFLVLIFFVSTLGCIFPDSESGYEELQYKILEGEEIGEISFEFDVIWPVSEAGKIYSLKSPSTIEAHDGGNGYLSHDYIHSNAGLTLLSLSMYTKFEAKDREGVEYRVSCGLTGDASWECPAGQDCVGTFLDRGICIIRDIPRTTLLTMVCDGGSLKVNVSDENIFETELLDTINGGSVQITTPWIRTDGMSAAPNSAVLDSDDCSPPSVPVPDPIPEPEPEPVDETPIVPACSVDADCGVGAWQCLSPGTEAAECDCSGGYHSTDTGECVADDAALPGGTTADSATTGGGDSYVCDVSEDADCDEVPTLEDNCPSEPNTDQEDSDEDGHGDACDACKEKHVDDVDWSSVSADDVSAGLGCPIGVVADTPADAGDPASDGDGFVRPTLTSFSESKGGGCFTLAPNANHFEWIYLLLIGFFLRLAKLRNKRGRA